MLVPQLPCSHRAIGFLKTGILPSTATLIKDTGSILKLVVFCISLLTAVPTDLLAVYHLTLLIYNSLREHTKRGSVVNCTLVCYLVKPCFVFLMCSIIFKIKQVWGVCLAFFESMDCYRRVAVEDVLIP